MRLAFFVLLLSLSLAGCARPGAEDAVREPTRAEDACVDATLTIEPPLLHAGEVAVIHERYVNCGDDTIWYYSYGCAGRPILSPATDAEVERAGEQRWPWMLGQRDGSATPMPLCATVMPDPRDLRPFAPGEVHEETSTWNGMVRTGDAIERAAAGIYEVRAGFATAGQLGHLEVALQPQE